MKTAAAKQASAIPASRRRAPQTGNPTRTDAKPLERETDSTADFLVGALLYSLFASGNLSELLPDGEAEQ